MTAQPAWMEVEPLPEATLNDARAARAYLLGRADGHSTVTATSDLRVIARALGYEDASSVPWTALRDEHLSYLFKRLLELEYKPESVNRLRAVLLGLFRRARVKGLITAEHLDELRAVPRVPSEPDKPAAGRALTSDEMTRLLAACDETPMGARDRCLLTWLWSTGMRLGEVCGLDLDHLDLEAGLVIIRRKNGKKQTVPLSDELVAAVKTYLAARGKDAGPLFYTAKMGAGRRLVPGRLGNSGVQHILVRLARAAGVERFSCHDLRRTFAGDMLDIGIDLATVQRLMGHAQASQTAQYDRRGIVSERKAVQARRLPTQEEARR